MTHMKGRLKYLGVLAALALAALVAAPVEAASFDVAFYELTEQMTFDGVTRTGEGALAGEAQPGTPLCPRRLAKDLVAAGFMRRGTPCYVTATGLDEINAKTGQGILTATIQVKVQGDNPVDAPELVVVAAQLTGQLQVLGVDVPLIMIWGTLTTSRLLDTSTFSLADVSAPGKQFTGMVRLPFVIEQGRTRKAARGETAYYLADDFVTLIPVQSNERSLGLPTARFELNFPDH